MFIYKILIFLVKLIKIAFCSSGALVRYPLEVTHTVWFQIAHVPVYYNKHDYIDMGTFEVGLFGKMYPTIVKNFVELVNVTKPGVGYKGTPLYVGYEDIMAEISCTIYGKYYKADGAMFVPHGPGWLSVLSRKNMTMLTSIFFLTILPQSKTRGPTYGKVIRGMPVIEVIRDLYPVTSTSRWSFSLKEGLYISDCGVNIPNKRFYVSKGTVPDFS